MRKKPVTITVKPDILHSLVAAGLWSMRLIEADEEVYLVEPKGRGYKVVLQKSSTSFKAPDWAYLGKDND